MTISHMHTIEREYAQDVHPLQLLDVSIERLKEEHTIMQVELLEMYKLARLIQYKVETQRKWSAQLSELRLKANAFKADLDRHAEWEVLELFPMVSRYFNEGIEQFYVMEQEHERAEQFILVLIRSLIKVPITQYDIGEIVMYLRQAYTILINHFWHEEEVLVALWEQSDAYGY